MGKGVCGGDKRRYGFGDEPLIAHGLGEQIRDDCGGLLQRVNAGLEQEIAGERAASAAAGTPYRMDEGNSCFGGGRPGVSDAYAWALWVAELKWHVFGMGFVYADREQRDKADGSCRAEC